MPGVVLPSHIVRAGALLSAGFVSLAISGCFVPGGGWTMRGGLDMRRSRKPSVFVELVDTRWDEYNRVAEMNLAGGMFDAHGAVIGPCPPGNGAIGPMPGGPAGAAPLAPPNGLPPAPVPTPRETLPDVFPNGEPRQLPGAPPDSEPPVPPAGVNATARLPRGPELFLDPPNDDAGTEGAPDRQPADDALGPSDDSNDDIELSSYKRAQAKKGGKKALLRPAASRLFAK